MLYTRVTRDSSRSLATKSDTSDGRFFISDPGFDKEISKTIGAAAAMFCRTAKTTQGWGWDDGRDPDAGAGDNH